MTKPRKLEQTDDIGRDLEMEPINPEQSRSKQTRVLGLKERTTYTTGYWAGFQDAKIGKHPFQSKVHSCENGKPLCGYKPSPKASFHFAAYSRTYCVTCKRCLAALATAPAGGES